MMLNLNIYEDIFIAANVQADTPVPSLEVPGRQVKSPRAGHDYHEELLLFNEFGLKRRLTICDVVSTPVKQPKLPKRNTLFSLQLLPSLPYLKSCQI